MPGYGIWGNDKDGYVRRNIETGTEETITKMEAFIISDNIKGYDNKIKDIPIEEIKIQEV